MSGHTPPDIRGLPREITVLIAAALAVMLGFGILAPAIPQFARTFGVSVGAASAVVAVFALTRVAFAPFAARVVQRQGERWTYVTGLLIVAVSSLACVFAQSYWQFLVLRSIGGVGSMMFTVSAYGLILRIAPDDMRGRVAGMYSTSIVAGNVLGPLVGAAVIGFGLRAPFAAYAAILVIVAVAVHLALRGSSHADGTPQAATANPMTFRQGLAVPAYRASLWSSFATGWTLFGARATVLPLLVVEVLNRSAVTAGLVLAVFATCNAAVLVYAGKLSDTFGRKPLILTGSIVFGVAVAFWGASPSMVVVFAAAAVGGIGAGMIIPAQQAAVGDVLAGRGRGGPVLAGFQAANDLGTVAGSFVPALIAQSGHYAAAFVLSGALLLANGVFWLLVADPRQRPTTVKA